MILINIPSGSFAYLEMLLMNNRYLKSMVVDEVVVGINLL